MQKIRKKVFDNHSHIGPVPGFAYFGLPEAVKPTTDYDTLEEYLKIQYGYIGEGAYWDPDINRWAKT